MNRLKRLIVMVGVVLGLLFTGCATPPEPFEYQQNNELKPGPGIFTGEKGGYTIYGRPPKPAREAAEASEEEGPASRPSSRLVVPRD